MKPLKFLLAFMLTVTGLNVSSQIAINNDGSNPHASAMLDVKSTTSGVLVPRMTSTQRDQIGSPAEGLMVYVTDMDLYYFYNGSAWVPFGSGGSGSPGWTISGNNMYSIVTGNVGIGTSSPTYKLSVDGGNVLIKGGDGWNSNNDEATLVLGDPNHSVFARYGVGIRIRTLNNSSHDIRFGGNNGVDYLTVQMLNGRVGICTSSPTSQLDVRTFTTTAGAVIQTGNSDLSHKLSLYGGHQSDPNAIIQWKGGDPLIFSTDENGWKEMMRITTNGNVGIGTTSPSEKFEVRSNNPGVPGSIVVGNYDLSRKIKLYTGYDGGQQPSYPALQWTAGTDFRFATDPWSEKMRITSDGNVGIGTASPSRKLTVRGNILIENSTGQAIVELGEGLDFAEGFDVSEKTKPEPGTVLIIDPDNPGELKISAIAYDTRVAGIVAGANDLGSGVKLGSGKFDCDVALAGRVYCKVDASYGEISVGDLLTTSSTPGYAMVVSDHTKASGAILGKAMQCLGKGEKGQILVLVTLQ